MFLLKKFYLSKPSLLYKKTFSCSQSTFSLCELKLIEYGNNIENCLRLETKNLTEQNVNDNLSIESKNFDLFVKLIGAPINPADINIIQGKYGILPPSLPAQIGNEGLFEVVKSTNQGFQPGDWVLQVGSGFGTWRSHAFASSKNFIKLELSSNKNLDLYRHALSTLKVNPCTAYRMLVDFCDLKENDTIIQNGANSAVGQSVIQLGRIMNLNVVNIVRKRDSQEKQDELNNHLRDLGAKYIFTEDELRKPVLTKDLWTKIAKPRLALNCVGGKATTDMVRLLDKNSILVTYGGMSRQPLTLNTADFIFKNLKCVGFWLTEWRKRNQDGDEFKKTIQYLIDLIEKGEFKAPKCKEFKLSEFKQALEFAQTPYHNNKILFVE